MIASRSLGLFATLFWSAHCVLATGCTGNDALTSSVRLQGTDSTDLDDISLFDSPDTAKRRKEQSLENKLARSLSSFSGVERVRVHLTLADTSVLLRTPQKKSHAAVLIVRKPDAAISIENLRRFITAAVPSLSDSDLEVTFTDSSMRQDKLVDLAYLQVAETSLVPLKITLTVLLGISIVSAVALIFAGIVIRKLKRTKT